jgi:hypothetical protein
MDPTLKHGIACRIIASQGNRAGEGSLLGIIQNEFCKIC